MRLLLDMNLSPRWSDFLNQVGHDSVHWSEIGDPKAADTEIMLYASTTDSIVVTHDLDFGDILAATGGSKPSVVQLRGDDITPEAFGGAVLTALEQCREDLEAGALLTIDNRRSRLTILPLRGAHG